MPVSGLRATTLVGAGSALAGAALAAASQTPWPEVPDPPRAKVAWVARDARINGLPTRIEHFESELGPDEVLAFYRAHWSQLPAGAPHAKRVGDWQTLSTVHGPFQIVVQAQPRLPVAPGTAPAQARSSGSQGMVSVANLGERRTDWMPADWPRFSDTTVAEVTDSVDGPLRSEYVVSLAHSDFEASISRWRGEWQRRGWLLVSEQRSAVGAPGARRWMAQFNKAPMSLDMTVSAPPGQRHVVIAANRVQPSAGGSR